MAAREKPLDKQAAEFVSFHLGKGAFAPFTGQDMAAWRAFVYAVRCWAVGKARVKAAREGVCPASLEYLEASDAVAALGPDGHPSPDMDRQIRGRLEEASKDLRACHERVKLEEARLEQAERELQTAAAAAERLL